MIPGWHPLVVHFPIALCIGSALALSAARIVRDERTARMLAITGTWNLLGAAVAALFAIATGIAALVHLRVDAAAHRAIFIHLKWAMLTSTATLLLAVWRGAGGPHDARPSRALLILLLLTSAAMAMTAYRGDVNVYRFGVGVGVGVAPARRAPAVSPAAAPIGASLATPVAGSQPPPRSLINATLAAI